MKFSHLKAGILYFPGTNCERDLELALNEAYGIETELLWHTNSFETKHDIYFVPGGFSYGDYLRSGALAARSLSLRSLKEAAAKGKMIAGICNGFQILTESRLLPGALIRNDSLKHICRWVDLAGQGSWENVLGENYSLPVSHSEGNFIAPEEDMKKIIDEDLIFLKYKSNVNGSMESIAGITDPTRRIIGLMPHPERAIFPSADEIRSHESPGRKFFEHLLQMI